MRTNLDKIRFLVGNENILSKSCCTPVLTMFSDQAMDFLSKLSKEILHDKRSRDYDDVTAYAYWIRKASIAAAKKEHDDYKNRIGRGIAFHVAPSNVPVNFAVSMTSSILAGNITFIRVSNKYFEQVDIICDAINRVIADEFSMMRPYFCIFRYEHDADITQFLSSLCDLRVVWGGDKTIETIRKAELPSRAIEMTFADRHSLAIIDSDFYLQQDSDSIAKKFYTDTYYTDQNACSSPRLVVWMGNNIEEARVRFWSALNKVVIDKYDMRPIQAVDKYTSLCILAMGYSGIKLISENNYILRVQTESLFPELMRFKNGGGYFFEYSAKELDEIVPVLSKQCQTISVLGIEKESIRKLVINYGVRGVDRIVSLGETMGLEFVWDGYKMIEAMSRYIYMEDSL